MRSGLELKSKLVIGDPMTSRAALPVTAMCGVAFAAALSLPVASGLGGGFAVSRLISGLGSPRDEHVKLAALVSSVIDPALATVVLGRRERGSPDPPEPRTRP
jgi:hypothetical protein